MSFYPKRTMPMDEWPAIDHDMWNRVFAEGDILGDRGRGADWAPSTKESTFYSYAKWLTWLSMNDHLEQISNPVGRITPTTIAAYVEDLRIAAASSTVMHHVLNLLRLAQAYDQSVDWRWLRRIANRLKARATPARDKEPRLRSSQELFELGLQLMSTAAKPVLRHTRDAPLIQYRDGLMIALLAARPIRLRNLGAIVIGQHLNSVSSQYWLRFAASETKNSRPLEFPLPRSLDNNVSHFLRRVRPQLLAGAASHKFWIATGGRPMPDKTLYERIISRTRFAFGKSISPHLFRDCAATSIAIEDPENVRITANILGHTSLTTSERHYNQAHMLAAGRTMQQSLLKLRNKRSSSEEALTYR
jgi:integrase/recombinase XerD